MSTARQSPCRDADFVSGRAIITKPDGLFWRSRWINDWSLLLTLNGAGEILLETGRVPVARRDLVLIAPEHAHSFRCSGPWDLLWIHFLMRPHLAAVPLWPEFLPGVRYSRLPEPEFPRARAALLEACQLDRRRPALWHPLAYTLLESVLLRGCGGAVQQPLPVAEAWLPRARKMLLDPTVPELSMDCIARRCYLSRTRFYNEIRRHCGISPRAYRELHRLRRAQQLLESTTLPVAEIARQIGMADPFYFATRFRKFCGNSPSEYRAHLRSHTPENRSATGKNSDGC